MYYAYTAKIKSILSYDILNWKLNIYNMFIIMVQIWPYRNTIKTTSAD